jgi:HEAT repeat protein
LIAALDQGLGVPSDTAISVWAFIREMAPKRYVDAQFRLGELHDERVFDAALEALRHPSSGREVQAMAFTVLGGDAHAPRITEEMLTDLVDRQHLRPGDLGHLIERVHRLRGVDRTLLLAIRDRWAESSTPSTRVASVEIGGLIRRPEHDYWRRMINDPSEEVRSAAVDIVSQKARTEFAKRVIEDRLAHEESVDVLADLHRGLERVLRRTSDGD